MMWGLRSGLEHGKTLCFGPAKYGNATQHLTVCLGDSQCILTYKWHTKKHLSQLLWTKDPYFKKYLL